MQVFLKMSIMHQSKGRFSPTQQCQQCSLSNLRTPKTRTNQSHRVKEHFVAVIVSYVFVFSHQPRWNVIKRTRLRGDRVANTKGQTNWSLEAPFPVHDMEFVSACLLIYKRRKCRGICSVPARQLGSRQVPVLHTSPPDWGSCPARLCQVCAP